MDAATSVAILYDRTGDDITRRRPGEPDAHFKAYVTSVDVDLLDERFQSASHRVRFQTAAVELEQGDEIAHAGTSYRLLRAPRRIADGHESEAPLTELQV